MDVNTDQFVYKPAGVAETFGIDWQPFLVSVWKPDRRYVAGDIIRLPVGNGYFYTAAIVAAAPYGMSGKLLPDFLAGNGETTDDGSIIWTAGVPGALAVPAISVSAWTLDAGVVEDSADIAGFDATVTVSGGSVGEQYRMTNRITKSNGGQEETSLVLEILDPADV